MELATQLGHFIDSNIRSPSPQQRANGWHSQCGRARLQHRRPAHDHADGDSGNQQQQGHLVLLVTTCTPACMATHKSVHSTTTQVATQAAATQAGFEHPEAAPTYPERRTRACRSSSARRAGICSGHKPPPAVSECVSVGPHEWHSRLFTGSWDPPMSARRTRPCCARRSRSPTCRGTHQDQRDQYLHQQHRCMHGRSQHPDECPHYPTRQRCGAYAMTITTIMSQQHHRQVQRAHAHTNQHARS